MDHNYEKIISGICRELFIAEDVGLVEYLEKKLVDTVMLSFGYVHTEQGYMSDVWSTERGMNHE